MRLINASYEILTDINSDKILKTIELAGRTCYKSEDRITDISAVAFADMIVNQYKHHSVIEHEHLSVRFIVDRGVSHELVRQRLASFSQESTRFCNYSKDKFGNEITFIRPCWWDKASLRSQDIWISSMINDENDYRDLIEEGWTPQEARSVLPNALKTEIVVTSNLRHWREIFSQRVAKNAHPQMREVMQPLLTDMQASIPIIFDDITY